MTAPIIQQDKFNIIASEQGRARQSRGGFCGLLRHSISRNDKRVFALTLAEVLITLVIIGVIAALTIPNLIAKHEEQQTVAKLKKTYSTLVTAQRLSIAETGEDYDKSRPPYHPYNAFKNYLKIVKDCGRMGTGCFAATEEYKTLGGVQAQVLKALSGTTTNTIVLDDGVAVAFVSTGLGYINYIGDIDNSKDPTVPYIYVDVNGIKPPNVFGRDTFLFAVLPNKIVPMGIHFNEPEYTCNLEYCNKKLCSIHGLQGANGIACTNWVITKGNMEYLKHDISE